MKNPILYLFLLIVFNPVASFSQTSEKEEVEEMATVYFVRLSKYATHAMYYILDTDSLININEGINWFRYDCEEGEHLFWITNRKNTDFLAGDLKAGESYMAIIYPYPGFGKTTMQLLSLTEEKGYFEAAKKFILSTDATSSSEEDIFHKMKALNKRKVIQESLEQYYNVWRFKRNYESLNDSTIIKDKDIRQLSKSN